MDESMLVGLQDELIADLTQELQDEPTFDASKLKQKVLNAIREVKRARKYPSNYTDNMINKDLYNYYSNIRNISLYDYNKMGAEFEQSHNENSVSRSWKDRDKLFNGVLPLSSFQKIVRVIKLQARLSDAGRSDYMVVGSE